ncbi:MAG: HEAT repeat domain-containing protein, partial [Planctomycetota bacterium]|nr:HEAT repeat domain-containing protein [Planctomycetota bacterium]
MLRCPRLLVALALIYLWPPAPALSYIDLAPTLSKIIAESDRIALAEVVQYSREKSVVVLKEVRSLKGDPWPDLIRHAVGLAGGGAVPRQIMQWASPGARCVMFVSDTTTLVCLGQGWYQVHAGGAGAWTLGADRPDLPLAYYGTVSRLVDSIASMLDGKNAVITVVAFGADNEGACFDLALNRQALPALVRVQRIRAHLKMPPVVVGVSANPAYFLGTGPVDAADLPALMEKLRHPDAMQRAEAANDLRCLGRQAAAAAAPLAELLSDSAPSVRFLAAAALLCISPPDARALEVLAQGLGSAELPVRRESARAAGLSGPAASPLADKLAVLLSADVIVRPGGRPLGGRTSYVADRWRGRPSGGRVHGAHLAQCHGGRGLQHHGLSRPAWPGRRRRHPRHPQRAHQEPGAALGDAVGDCARQVLPMAWLRAVRHA